MRRAKGGGGGFNRNFPLPEGTDGETYLQTLEKAIRRIERFKPAIVVVSMGFDMLKGDPTGSFRVPVSTMTSIGKRLGSLGLPLLVVQEGGYSLRNLRRGAPLLFSGMAAAISGNTNRAG